MPPPGRPASPTGRRPPYRLLWTFRVHSAQGADLCEEFAKKNKITFPLVLDTGKTAKHYAVNGLPAYFLIDKTGKITAFPSTRVPEEQQIEQLLSQ